jgi:putative copper resistance protein D
VSPDAALAVCRFLHDASAMFLWGASAYLSTLVPRNLAQDLGRRLRFFCVVATALAIATTFLFLPLETAFIGEGWGDALDLATIRDVLFETSVGRAWQVQAAAALILIAAVAVPSRSRKTAVTLASGFVLASVAITGHAVMGAGMVGLAHRVNDAIHILSAGAWLGALVPLLAVFKAINDRAHRREAEAALSRFSRAGYVIVALIVASGVINTVLVLGRWPTNWSSPYQTMLAAKVALVAVMVAVATLNRYVFVPRIARQPSLSLRALRLGTIAEMTLGICVLGLVSVFGMLEPM